MHVEKIWIVYKQRPTGKIERIAAWFSEKLAREQAAELVGKDGALIGLETINVIDEKPLNYPSVTDDEDRAAFT